MPEAKGRYIIPSGAVRKHNEARAQRFQEAWAEEEKAKQELAAQKKNTPKRKTNVKKTQTNSKAKSSVKAS